MDTTNTEMVPEFVLDLREEVVFNDNPTLAELMAEVHGVQPQLQTVDMIPEMAMPVVIEGQRMTVREIATALGMDPKDKTHVKIARDFVGFLTACKDDDGNPLAVDTGDTVKANPGERGRPFNVYLVAKNLGAKLAQFLTERLG